MKAWTWEQTDGVWFVVEHDGMLKTGPFSTKEKAQEFFREEFDLELVEAFQQ